MQCSNCQAVNPPGSKFCYRCGKALEAQRAPVPHAVPARREVGLPPARPDQARRGREEPHLGEPPPGPPQAAIPERSRRRVPGVVWFVAGVVLLAAAGALLWALDLVQLGPPPEKVVVTQFVEVTPRPTRVRRSRGEATPAHDVVVETVVVSAEPPAEPIVAVEPTEAPEEPVEVVVEPSLPEDAYVERAERGDFSGTTVRIITYLTDEQLEGLDASIAGFRDRSGIAIEFESSPQDFPDYLAVRVEAGDPPDIAIVNSNSMGELADLAAAGVVVDLGSFLDRERHLGNYAQMWLDLATLEGPERPILAGIWGRAQPRSLVYYALDDFDAAGYGIPETMVELQELSEQMVANGHTPWCIGIESASATGWVAHQWLEEMMVRTATREEYDFWIAGRLPFDSPQVREAADALARIWFSEGSVVGGRESIAGTPWLEAAIPMFDEPAGCMMTYMGPWAPSTFPESAEYGETYGIFPLPAPDVPAAPPLIVLGDVWAMFDDREEVRAVLAFIARGEHAQRMIEGDVNAIVPHLNVGLDWYPDDGQRRLAEILGWATDVRLPAIDLMLGRNLNPDRFWPLLTAWVAGDEDVETILAEIEEGRP